MRIISKTKDYYDGCQRYGMDEKFCYVRKSETIKDIPDSLKKYVDQCTWSYKRAQGSPYVTREILGFCGKIYGVLRCAPSPYNLSPEDTFKYKPPQTEKNKKNKRNSFRNLKIWEKQSLGEFLGATLDDQPFIDVNAPIFYIRVTHPTYGDGTILKTNITLSDVKFHTQMDPFTTYQEIEMYLRNNLANTKDPIMPVGDDVCVASSKGFDKFSFRKDKSKKK